MHLLSPESASVPSCLPHRDCWKCFLGLLKQVQWAIMHREGRRSTDFSSSFKIILLWWQPIQIFSLRLGGLSTKWLLMASLFSWVDWGQCLTPPFIWRIFCYPEPYLLWSCSFHLPRGLSSFIWNVTMGRKSRLKKFKWDNGHHSFPSMKLMFKGAHV